ncbi:MAG: hypothetical protein IJO03_11875 [Clostridia bacterium]|nr:hypothetical protein [Clostridia bacterium]MBQ7122949.1 hypothetical protein [Clostridia bacterium]
MLGYVKAFKPEMKIKDYELYRGIYCSLCRALGRNYSPIAQLFLSYDFAFAAVLRLAVSQDCCSFTQKRCPYNPAKKCMICGSREELDFCSHAVIITVFYKVLDNLHDKGLKSKLVAMLIYPVVWLMHKKAVRLAPDAEKIVAESMKMQSEAENKSGAGIDEAAHPSADALGKIISLGFEGEKKKSLYSLGYMVGRFVYILDAADDFEDDIKSGNFNPFKESFGDIENSECRKAFAQKIREMLNLTHSNALDALDETEKNRFEDILENIVFDGLVHSSNAVLSKYTGKTGERCNNEKSV